MVEVKKIPPLRCSHCQSTRVHKDKGGTNCDDCGMREYRGKLIDTKAKKWDVMRGFRGAGPKVDPYNE